MLNPLNLISRFIKSSNQKELDKIQKIVEKINALENEISKLEDLDFPKKTEEFIEKIQNVPKSTPDMTLLVGSTTNGSGANLQVAAGGGGIAIGGDQYGNGSGTFKFLCSNSVTNWQVGTNVTQGGAFEIMPSTAAGGSTFSTPAMYITSAGNATFAGSITAAGAGSFDSVYTGSNSNGGGNYTGAHLASTGVGYFTAAAGSTNVFSGYTTGSTTPTCTITAAGAATFAGKITLSNSSGIQFGITDNPSASGGINIESQTLDDYEEGFWTPGGLWTAVDGTYTKIGRVVHAAFAVKCATTGSADMIITDLPFSCTNNEASRNGLFLGWNEFDSRTQGNLCGNLAMGTNTFYFYLMDGGNSANYDDLGINKWIKGVICYQV